MCSPKCTPSIISATNATAQVAAHRSELALGAVHELLVSRALADAADSDRLRQRFQLARIPPGRYS
jgi:hypothetical protein